MFEKISIILFLGILIFELNFMNLKTYFGDYFKGPRFKYYLFLTSLIYFAIGVLMNIQKFTIIEQEDNYKLPKASQISFMERILQMPDNYPQKDLLNWLYTYASGSTLFLSEEQLQECQLYKIPLIGLAHVKIHLIQHPAQANPVTHLKQFEGINTSCQLRINTMDNYKNTNIYIVSQDNQLLMVSQDKIQKSRA